MVIYGVMDYITLVTQELCCYHFSFAWLHNSVDVVIIIESWIVIQELVTNSVSPSISHV